MPAVHVDLSAVPRITAIDSKETKERRTLTVADAPKMLEGAGFEVRRASLESTCGLLIPSSC